MVDIQDVDLLGVVIDRVPDPVLAAPGPPVPLVLLAAEDLESIEATLELLSALELQDRLGRDRSWRPRWW